jgi:hypothetical protein
MPTAVDNFIVGMANNKGNIVDKFGLDQTGTIAYQFNNQGFRDTRDYTFVPDYAFFGCSLVFGIGVDHASTFVSQFPNSHNYGLAGKYSDQDVYETIQNFLKSDLCNPLSKKVVVWKNQSCSNLHHYYQKLKPFNFVHFFCYNPVLESDCFSVPKELDQDVSLTHMGPKTHKFFYQILCTILNQ